MRYFLYFYLFRIFFGNPLLALLLVFLIYFMVDRQFIGLLPDVFKPLRRKGQIKNLQQQININPANVNAIKELGSLYLEEKKYSFAVKYLSQTLDKMGEYADTHFSLGKALYLQGEKDQGVQELEKATKISSKVGYGEPYIYLLEAEIKHGQDQQKIRELVSDLKRFGTPEILYKAGKVLKNFDQDQATKMFAEALDTYKGSPKHFRKTYRRWALLAKLNLIGK